MNQPVERPDSEAADTAESKGQREASVGRADFVDWSLWRLGERLDKALQETRDNERLRAWGSQLDKDLSAERAKRVSLEIEIENSERRAAELCGKLKELSAEKARRAVLEAEIESSERRAADLGRELAEARCRLAAAANLSRELAEAKGELALIVGSRSWRYTSAIRSVVRFFRTVVSGGFRK